MLSNFKVVWWFGAWYFALTIFALVGGSNLAWVDLFGGLILMWVLQITFASGFTLKMDEAINLDRDSQILKKLHPVSFFGLSIFSVFLSLFATSFYTGKGFQEVLSSVSSGDSLYLDYQLYFMEQGIAEFSISKIPAIISFFLMKLILVYSTIDFFLAERKNNFFKIFNYILILCSYLFFSTARGTSFELYEILMLIWFSSRVKIFVFDLKPTGITYQKIFFVILLVAAVMLYNYNIQTRYSFGQVDSPTAELGIDKDSIIYFISVPLAQLSNKLSGYFTFGIFYTSTFISHILFDNFLSFITYLFPFSLVTTPSITDQVCGVIIDCGVAWKPDTLKLIESVGITGMCIFIFYLGSFCNWIMRSILVDFSYNKIILFFYICLAMISLPIGNFVLVSSANIILLTVSIVLFLFRFFQKSRNEKII